MENNFVNLFSLTYDAINGMKKDLVDHIENLKGKLLVGNDIQGYPYLDVCKDSQWHYYFFTVNYFNKCRFYLVSFTNVKIRMWFIR